jgi:hypothetical protein
MTILLDLILTLLWSAGILLAVSLTFRLMISRRVQHSTVPINQEKGKF